MSASLTLQDLTRPEGLQQVLDATGGTRSFYNQPGKLTELAVVANRAISRNPRLGQVKVRPVSNLPNAFYDYEKGEITLGIVNPAILAHEIEHADNLKQATMYAKMIRAAEGLARLNHTAALPTMLALRAFIDDKDRRDDILRTLDGVSAAIAAPGRNEEFNATVSALKNNPGRRLEFLKTLGPAYAAHVAHSSIPSMIYAAGSAL